MDGRSGAMEWSHITGGAKHFKKALIEAGEVRLLSPHCCRHTYVSQLQAQGVPLETIQSLTGHADVDMTEHYLHVQKEVKEDAAQKLNAYAATTNHLDRQN